MITIFQNLNFLDNKFNNLFGYPDISLSSNPEYKYKYPKFTEEEYSRQQRQIKEGAPNDLNRFLRQELTS